MKNLATKYTRKKRNFNKKNLAKKLDNITNNVAKRGVFVVKKTDPGFNVVNYINNKVYVENVPFNTTAKQLCKLLNDKKQTDKPDATRVSRLCDKFYKHYNDIHFYKHTINTSKDLQRKLIAQTRMEESVMMLKEVRRQFSMY